MKTITVGEDIGALFFRGAVIGEPLKPTAIFNPFPGAVLYLSEPEQNQLAVMFAGYQGNALYAVTLRAGVTLLDLSDDYARKGQLMGQSPVIKISSDSVPDWREVISYCGAVGCVGFRLVDETVLARLDCIEGVRLATAGERVTRQRMPTNGSQYWRPPAARLADAV